MKKLFTAGLLLLAMGASAQNKYTSVRTNHYRDGALRAYTTKIQAGSFQTTGETISIDADKYTILKHGALQTADGGQYVQTMILVLPTKSGSYKVMDAEVLYKADKRTVAEVKIQRTKGTNVIYYFD